MIATRSGSILAADFGSVRTRLVLIDLVDGSYRLVARAEGRTTSGFPYNDVNVGLARTVAQLSQVTGRKLIDNNRQIIMPENADRSGVDYFVATASTGRPLRTIMVGLVPAISIASGLRAAAGTYVEIVETLSLEDLRGADEQINAIIRNKPDLIFITGGTEGGAQEPLLQLARTVQTALQLVERPRRPVILYAGNSVTAPQIRMMFANLTTFFDAPNVRPTLEDELLEAAQLQLGRAFDSYTANRGGGFETIAEASELGVLPTAQSYNLVIEYMGKAQNSPILAVDVGSAVSTMSAYINGDVDTTIRTDIGLGHSAHTLLEILGIDEVRRWLPFNVTDEEMHSYTWNKTLRPSTIPETLRDLYIEHALLRAGIQALAQASRPMWNKSARVNVNAPLPAFNPIIGAGAAITQTGSPGLSALLLLDTLQPEGVVRLQTDPNGLIPTLGALAYVKPEAVVQVLESLSLENLGTSVSLSGHPRAGRPAMRVRITTPDGDRIEEVINGDSLWVYPLAPGQEVEVDVRVLARGTSIGGKGRVRMKLEGGTLGLIFDARGRSLLLAADSRGRAQQLPLWISQVTGNPVQPIDERWLEAAPKAVEKAQPKSERPQRRGRRGQQQPEPQEDVDLEFDLDELRK